MWFAISLYMVFALSMSQDLSSKRFCMDFWCLFSREGFTSSNHKDLLAAFLASEPRFTKAPCPWVVRSNHHFPPLPRPFRSSRRSSWGNVRPTAGSRSFCHPLCSLPSQQHYLAQWGEWGPPFLSACWNCETSPDQALQFSTKYRYK